MNEFIEKLIARIMLESASCKVYKLINPNKEDIAEFNAYKKCIEIVNQLAEEYKPKTQADKIRAMSDEELAEFFSKRDKIPNRYKCKEIEDWVKWLQSEA